MNDVGGRIEIREPLCRYTEEELYRQTALFKILIEWEMLFIDLKRIASAVLVSNEWKELFEIKREVEEVYSQIVSQEEQEEEDYFNNLKPNQEFVRAGWEKTRRTLFKSQRLLLKEFMFTKEIKLNEKMEVGIVTIGIGEKQSTQRVTGTQE